MSLTNRKPFITVYKPIAGWKAMMVWWNPEMGGFWEPYETSPVAFATKEEAANYGESWAAAEGIEFKLEGA